MVKVNMNMIGNICCIHHNRCEDKQIEERKAAVFAAAFDYHMNRIS